MIDDHTVKHIRISTDILWGVFRILTEPVPHTFVSVNQRNNEARPMHMQCGFVISSDTNVCGTSSVKMWKTCHRKIRGYMHIFSA